MKNKETEVQKKPAHEFIIAALGGEHNKALSKFYCAESIIIVPVLAVLVTETKFPDKAIPNLITAFIKAGRQYGHEDDVRNAVAMALKNLNGGEELLRVLTEEVTEKGNERDYLLTIAEGMKLKVPESESCPGA
ncbi:hypothetical protein KKF32_01215 [Patescibacteria group bacterium]|nr:hypothetical protein [Patescibacteria group bacterium]